MTSEHTRKSWIGDVLIIAKEEMAVSVQKILHKGMARIQVTVPYGDVAIQQLKQVEGCRWSASRKCWHVPYTKAAYVHLQTLFPVLEIISVPEEQPAPMEQPVVQVPPSAPDQVKNPVRTSVPVLETPAETGRKADVLLTFHGKKMVLRVPKNAVDIQFIRSLQYARWDPTGFCWLITDSEVNRSLVRNYFRERLEEKTVVVDESATGKPAEPPKQAFPNRTLLVIPYNRGRLKLLFRYDKELVLLLKKQPFRQWGPTNQWCSLPDSEPIRVALLEFCQEKGWEWREQAEQKPKRPLRIKAESLPNYRECPDEYIEKMTLRRYSWRTIKSYKTHFRAFINHYHTRKIDEITEKEVLQYLRYLVTDCGVSASYQNQVINAIKFYYEQVLGGQRKFYAVERPRKEQTLPVVLSEEEVQRLLQAVNNLKHKCLLLVGYSAGLRVGEVLKLELPDLDRDRMRIHVKGAKGKKDRMTLLSEKTLRYLEEYLALYQPKRWLFEGPDEGPYSASSIQAILKQACRQALITKPVHFHTLRHSFATGRRACIFWKEERICDIFRYCWGTSLLKPRRFTPM